MDFPWRPVNYTLADQMNGRGYRNSGTQWNALHSYFQCVPL